jgi:hypothetical protein
MAVATALRCGARRAAGATLRRLALVGLVLVALQGAAVPVHAWLAAPHPSRADLLVAGSEAPSLRGAASHDAAECPLCRELARSRAAAIPAPPGIALRAIALQPVPLRSAIAAAPRIAAGVSGPRAPPAPVAAPTA